MILKKDQTLEGLRQFLNTHEPRIQFTLEEEENRTLPFLDLLIRRTYDNKLVTKVYRKATHTQKYIHWRSNHSRECKIGVMKTLIHRAYRLCDLVEDLKEELDLLRDVFISNGYPVKIVEKTIYQWKPEDKNGNENLEEQEEFSKLYIPFIAGLSERMQKYLKKEGLKLVFSKGRTLYNDLCKLKNLMPMEQKSDVVYRFECKTCGLTYIGETCQTFQARRGQHQRDVRLREKKNAIYMHLKSNRRHKIDWEKGRFLDQEQHWQKRKIKESLYINATNPAKEIRNLMNLDKGHKLNACWEEFNSLIKEKIRS